TSAGWRRLYPVRQREGGLPFETRGWQAGENTLQLPGRGKGTPSGTEHSAEAGRYDRGAVSNGRRKTHEQTSESLGPNACPDACPGAEPSVGTGRLRPAVPGGRARQQPAGAHA